MRRLSGKSTFFEEIRGDLRRLSGKSIFFEEIRGDLRRFEEAFWKIYIF